MHTSLKTVAGLLVLAALAAPALAGKKGHSSWTQTWSSDSDQRDFAYALVEPSDDGGSLTLTGLESDRDELLRLRDRIDGTFVWIRSGSKRALIRDEAMVERAQEIMSPEIELNRSSGRLGGVQGSLGGTQGELGAEQGRLGERQARLGVAQARLAMRAAGKSMTPAQRREWQREMDELSAEQEELAGLQERLARKQEAMGEDQERLGAEQSRFAEHRKEVCAQVRREMKEFLADATARGLTEKP
jgi:bla regulator protein blaR1